MTLAVTGASGHLGRKVADVVLDRLHPADLVLLMRTPESLSVYRRRGVAVLHADFDEPASLVAGPAGVDRVLLISALDLERRDRLAPGRDRRRSGGRREPRDLHLDPVPER